MIKNTMLSAPSEGDVMIDNDPVTTLLNDLGIDRSNQKNSNLLIWNDHINDMVYVVVALVEVCKITPDKAVEVMMEAHVKGKAIVKSGPKDELEAMKQGLNDRYIDATVEED